MNNTIITALQDRTEVRIVSCHGIPWVRKMLATGGVTIERPGRVCPTDQQQKVAREFGGIISRSGDDRQECSIFFQSVIDFTDFWEELLRIS